MFISSSVEQARGSENKKRVCSLLEKMTVEERAKKRARTVDTDSDAQVASTGSQMKGELGSFEQLARDVLQLILSFLPVKCLIRFSLTSSRGHDFFREILEVTYQKRVAELAPFHVLPVKDNSNNLLFRLRMLRIWSQRQTRVDTGVGHTIVVKQYRKDCRQAEEGAGRATKVYSFGEGSFGTLGLGSLTTQVKPKEVDTKVFLEAEETEKGTEAQHSRKQFDFPERVIDVSCGTFHSGVLSSHGKVYTFGFGDGQRLGYHVDDKQLIPRLVPFTATIPVKRISLGCNHGLLLTRTGQVYSFGRAKSSGALGLDEVREAKPTRISSLKGITCIGISAGEMHSMFLSDDGELFTCGKGGYGRLGHGSEKTLSRPKCVEYFVNRNIKICHISAGGNFSFAIDDEGKLFSFGAGVSGKLGHGHVENDSFAYCHGPCQRGDFQNQMFPTLVRYFLEKNLKVADCAAGSSHSAVLTCGGNVYTFGCNRYGKLGLGDEFDYHEPTKINLESHEREGHELKFLSVTAGDWHTILVGEDNELYTFGGGWFGRLGHGDQMNKSVPAHVTALS